jgi:hypothetical protein
MSRFSRNIISGKIAQEIEAGVETVMGREISARRSVPLA